MWTAVIRSTIALAALVFMMQALRWILTPILGVANSGPNSSADSVQRIGGYFGALTVENLTLFAVLAVAVYLLARASVERRLG